MLSIVQRLLLSALFVSALFACLTFISGLDFAMTKDEKTLELHNSLFEALPFVFALGFIVALKDALITPILNGLEYNKSWLKGDILHRSHKLRITYRGCHFRSGWFGILKMHIIEGKFYIPVNAGGIWDGHKYKMNPLFVSYLSTFRGYSISGGGDFLVKSIK